jgi:hypothetical protein
LRKFISHSISQKIPLDDHLAQRGPLLPSQALLLEETGLPYEVVPVDTRKGEQHSADFKQNRRLVLTEYTLNAIE